MDGYSETETAIATDLRAARLGAGLLAGHREPNDAGPTPEELRSFAWEIAARWQLPVLLAQGSHVTLAAVTPTTAFAAWRIDDAWIREFVASKGDAWRDCRLVLRLYDVSLIPDR